MEYGKCHNCGALNPLNAEKCRICGVKFNREIVQCGECGRVIPSWVEVCPYCGAVFKKHEQSKPLNVPTIMITSKAQKEPRKGGIWNGILIGFIIGILVSMAVIYPLVISPLQAENTGLKISLEELQQEYRNLSIENANLSIENKRLNNQYEMLNTSHEALLLQYKELNESYLQKTREYNDLLLNYTDLLRKYDSMMNPPEDLKFIVVLYFQTDYFSSSHEYWLYMKVNVSDFMSYRAMEHKGMTSYDSAPGYVIIDDYILDIVTAVKSKLVDGTDEEMVDALMSISQNKAKADEGINTTQPEAGTYYNIDATVKFPLETLVMHSGECMDDVILFQSLVKAAGISGAFLFIPEENHVKGGVILPSEPVHSTPGLFANYYVATVGDYYPAEITAYGWKIGQIGNDEAGMSVDIVPVP